jgi:hypothetical protein
MPIACGLGKAQVNKYRVAAYTSRHIDHPAFRRSDELKQRWESIFSGTPSKQIESDIVIPAANLHGEPAPSLSSRPKRSGAEGPAVPRAHRGNAKFNPQTQSSRMRRPERPGADRQRRPDEGQCLLVLIRCISPVTAYILQPRCRSHATISDKS